MSFRFRIAMGLALLLALGFAVPVFAGGWAVITLDELPSNSVAGEPLRIGFTVLQHGRTPMTNFEPTVTAGLALDEKLVVYAEPEGKPGHYVATLTFPKRVFLKLLLPSFSYTDFAETTERSLFITVFSAKLSEIRGVRVPKSL